MYLYISFLLCSRAGNLFKGTGFNVDFKKKKQMIYFYYTKSCIEILPKVVAFIDG